MSRPDLAVIGGGLLGRLLAWRAAMAGLKVSLFCAGNRLGHDSTAWVAGGMVAPQAEAEDTDAVLIAKGQASLALWPRWISELRTPVHYDAAGTLILWQRSEAAEAKRFEALLRAKLRSSNYQRLTEEQVAEVEPGLEARCFEALHAKEDAHIDNRQLLAALAVALDDAGVVCYWNRPVADEEQIEAALTVDCRGKHARSRWSALRWVRGEIVRLHAPGLELRHMVRLLQRGASTYLVSRPGNNLLIGATAVESDDCSAASVRGTLELLSAAYSLFPELGEARILELNTGCRPALPDNCPAIRFDPTRRLLEVNGLYRHGFLLSPAVVNDLMPALPLLLSDPAASQCVLPQWLLPRAA